MESDEKGETDRTKTVEVKIEQKNKPEQIKKKIEEKKFQGNLQTEKNQQSEVEESEEEESEEEQKPIKNTAPEKKQTIKKTSAQNGRKKLESEPPAQKKRETQKVAKNEKKEMKEERRFSRRRQWAVPAFDEETVLEEVTKSKMQTQDRNIKSNSRRRPLSNEQNNIFGRLSSQTDGPVDLAPRELSNTSSAPRRGNNLRIRSGSVEEEPKSESTPSTSFKKTTSKKLVRTQILEEENDHKSLAQYMFDAALLMYKHLGLDVNKDGGQDALKSAVAETSRLLHDIEKVRKASAGPALKLTREK